MKQSLYARPENLEAPLGRWLRGLVLAGTMAIAGSCTSLEHSSVPSDLVDQVSVGGLGDLRIWADEFTGDIDAFSQSYAELAREHYSANGRKLNILTLSGGGQSGAYGAGFLNGWTASGNRPQFDIVTGVSTGAIIGPFAFLGPAFDPVLKEIYTTTRTRDIGRVDLVGGLTSRDGLLDVAGFRNLLEKHVTPALLAQIASESRNGRLLLIGTTNLEAERGVIWNMSALAMSNYPSKLGLFRDIIQASASIPGAFPPVQISVDHEGQSFQELHADGGVTEQVFLYPPNVSIKQVEKALGFELEKRVFVVRNTKLNAAYKELKQSTVDIVERSLNTLIRNQGLADVRRIHDIAQRDGIDFNRTSVPENFNRKSKGFFDPQFMQPLFDTGYKNAVSATPWDKTRP